MAHVPVSRELQLRLETIAAWEEEANGVDLLKWSNDYLKSRVRPSLRADRRCAQAVFRRLAHRGYTQREMARVAGMAVANVNRRLRGQYQQPRRKTGGRRLAKVSGE
jgi:SOS response regulatory protein OraA/RecX